VAHVRKLIRDRVAATLTGLTTTGSNVYTSRVYPIVTGELPALLVYTKEEMIEHISMSVATTSNRHQKRTLEVAVEVFVKGVAGYDNLVDQICEEVEVALAVDPDLGGYAQKATLTSFSADFIGEADQPLGFASLGISVQYDTREGTPSTAI
jgi:hypothetical protein